MDKILLKDKYDVIIVGAGPAGLSCAIELQKSQMSVLLLEKNSVIGPKICAGGLTTKVKDLGIPFDIAEILFSSVLLSTTHMTTNFPNGNIPFVGTIDRKKLGQYLKGQLSDKITVRTGYEAAQIQNEYIVVNDRKIKYKYLVGADGSNSIVRRFLKIKNEKFLSAIQYIIPRNDEKLEFYFNAKLFGSGYSWIFPHKGYSSVGCAQDARNLKSTNLKSNLDQWLTQKIIETRDAKLQGWTISFDYQGFRFNNIFLVGDAGGFASGLTGEGIYFGMVSGRDVGRKIIDPNYKCEGIKKILNTKRYHERMLGIGNFAVKINRNAANLLFKCLLIAGRNKLISKFLIKKFG